MALEIRTATPDDAETIHRFVSELAEYEREPDAVEPTPETFREQLAGDRPPFECLIAERDGAPVGFALFFQSYSTWKGRPGLWLEDLYVPPALRRGGVGLALLREVALIADARGYGRIEWSVLDWNEPAIRFYESLGAVGMTEWTTMRLAGDGIGKLARRE